MKSSNESITIVIPIPNKVLQPNCTIGSFGGRMMVNNARKKYKRITREAIEEENIETKPWNFVSVSAKFYFKTSRRRDTDNAIGSLKSAYDGIAESGLIVDDDKKHMQRIEPDFFIDKNNPRVELTITRVK